MFKHLEEVVIQALKKHIKNYESGFSEKFTITIEPVIGQSLDRSGRLRHPPRTEGSIELAQFNVILQMDNQETQSMRSVIPRALLDETKAWKWAKQKHPSPHNPEDWE